MIKRFWNWLWGKPEIEPKPQIEVIFDPDSIVDFNEPLIAKQVQMIAVNPTLAQIYNNYLKKYFAILSKIDPVNGTKEEKNAYVEARHKINSIVEIKRFMREVVDQAFDEAKERMHLNE